MDFGVVEDKIGVKKVINVTLIVLIISTLLAIIAPKLIFQSNYFGCGILIGFMVGPNQSSSRSLMSRLTPKEKVNEFFGFYALQVKLHLF